MSSELRLQALNTYRCAEMRVIHSIGVGTGIFWRLGLIRFTLALNTISTLHSVSLLVALHWCIRIVLASH
jgi:hypothetical protein